LFNQMNYTRYRISDPDNIWGRRQPALRTRTFHRTYCM
jgi:hypothetical protein